MERKYKKADYNTKPMKSKQVELDLTDLEWEIVNAAIHGPIRDLLLQHIKDYQMETTEEELDKAWDSVQAKWETAG